VLSSWFERASNGFAHSIVMKLTLIRVAGIMVLLAAVAIYFLLRPTIEYEALGGGYELKVVRTFFSPVGSSVGCQLYYKTPDGQHVPLCAYLWTVHVEKELAIYTCDSDEKIFVVRAGNSATNVTEAVLRYGCFMQTGDDGSQSILRSGVHWTIYEFERHGDQYKVMAGGGNTNLDFFITLREIEFISGLN